MVSGVVINHRGMGMLVTCSYLCGFCLMHESLASVVDMVSSSESHLRYRMIYSMLVCVGGRGVGGGGGGMDNQKTVVS